MDKELIVESHERIDDLQCHDLKIISNPEIFCFGIDAVLLANYAKAGRGKKVLDMGTGNGIIPILMSGKCPEAVYTGLELQELSYDLARRSVLLNGIGDKVNIVQGDIKEASHIFGGASFDIVTTNPPYMNENHGIVNPDSCKAIARHELKCTLEDVVAQGAAVLKEKGTFYMVHRPYRLADIIATMRKYRLEPKDIVFVYPHEDDEANILLITAVKGGKPFAKVKSLVMYNHDGEYTQAMNKWIEN